MSRGTFRASAVAVVVGLAVLSLSACTMNIGADPPPLPAAHRPPTLGEELRDLKVARDAGALNEEEYGKAKQRLLESHDKK